MNIPKYAVIMHHKDDDDMYLDGMYMILSDAESHIVEENADPEQVEFYVYEIRK